MQGISDNYLETLRQNLIKNEGIKLFPYRDMFNNLTIGAGRNLDSVGISKDEALFLMNNDIQKSINFLSEFPWWNELNELRKIILTEMCFNLGATKFKEFKKMIDALGSKNYTLAAKEMMDSSWAREVKERAANLSFLMREGSL